jgi:lysozyme
MIKTSYAELEKCVMTDKAVDIAIPLIVASEGFKAKAYKCPAGVWTIGFGRTSASGAEVTEKTVTNREAEDKWLRAKVDRMCSYVRQKALNTEIGQTLNDNQVAALVSLIYNIGENNFKSSGVRRNLLLGKIPEAVACWLKWNKGGGIVLAGLVRRRAAEVALFQKSEV